MLDALGGGVVGAFAKHEWDKHRADKEHERERERVAEAYPAGEPHVVQHHERSGRAGGDTSGRGGCLQVSLAL